MTICIRFYYCNYFSSFRLINYIFNIILYIIQINFCPNRSLFTEMIAFSWQKQIPVP